MAKKSKWACARKRRTWLNSSRKQLELFTGHTRKTGFGWILFDLLQFVVEQMILFVSDTRIVVTVARLLISFFFLAVCCCMAVCWWLPTTVHCTKPLWLYERYLTVIEENSFAFAHTYRHCIPITSQIYFTCTLIQIYPTPSKSLLLHVCWSKKYTSIYFFLSQLWLGENQTIFDLVCGIKLIGNWYSQHQIKITKMYQQR